MKKLAILLLVLFVAAGLSGCKSEEEKRREAAEELGKQLFAPEGKEKKPLRKYGDFSGFDQPDKKEKK